MRKYLSLFLALILALTAAVVPAMAEKTIKNDKRNDSIEKAMAYYILAGVYSRGVPNFVKANVNYAYECIKKCAELDPEFAKSEPHFPEFFRLNANI